MRKPNTSTKKKFITVQSVVNNAAAAYHIAEGYEAIQRLDHNTFLNFLYITTPSAVGFNTRTVERSLRRWSRNLKISIGLN